LNHRPKARTAGVLGSDYKILSSFGHVRDLPKSAFGVDIEHDFEPKYILTAKGKSTVKELKAQAAKADNILISTDPDREGEANRLASWWKH